MNFKLNVEMNVEMNFKMNVETNVEMNVEMNVAMNGQMNVEVDVKMNVEMKLGFNTQTAPPPPLPSRAEIKPVIKDHGKKKTRLEGNVKHQGQTIAKETVCRIANIWKAVADHDERMAMYLEKKNRAKKLIGTELKNILVGVGGQIHGDAASSGSAVADHMEDAEGLEAEGEKGETPLSGGNDGNAKNLKACTGECDNDGQCTA